MRRRTTGPAGGFRFVVEDPLEEVRKTRVGGETPAAPIHKRGATHFPAGNPANDKKPRSVRGSGFSLSRAKEPLAQAAFSSRTAQTLNSGIPHTGSSAAFVSRFAAAWA